MISIKEKMKMECSQIETLDPPCKLSWKHGNIPQSLVKIRGKDSKFSRQMLRYAKQDLDSPSQMVFD